MTTISSTTDPGPTVMDLEDVQESVKLFTIASHTISARTLKELLPDIETALFFAKAYQLDYVQVSDLIRALFDSPFITALLEEGHEHSTELQDYLVEIVPDYLQADLGTATFVPSDNQPDLDLLKHAFESATITIAQSIQDVVDKIGDVLTSFPTKYGEMTFGHLLKFNRQYNGIGTYEAGVQHKATPPRLVVLDVSGSMTSSTIRVIVEPVVRLAYEINATLAIVSDNAFAWEPNTYSVDDVLSKAEYGGTHYEKLAPLFDQDWETVVTVADYDSAWTARKYIRDNASGYIHQVLDVSLVNRPTFLSECLGMIAGEVRPLLIGTSAYL